MADEKPSNGVLVHMVKLLIKTFLDGIFDDLMENNVLNTDEIHLIGKCLKFVVSNAENLVDDITETAQIAGKIFREHLWNSKKQLSSDISSDGERGANMPGLNICNKEFNYLHNRNGSELDLLGMRDLLENLGYSVVIKENLTAQEMETALRQFAAHPEHQSSDSTFLVFMSHGILNGICGTKHWDQEPDVLHDDTIFEIFNNRNCQSLKDKPKMVLGLFGSPLTVEKPVQILMVGSCKVTSVMMLLQRLMWKRTSLLSNLPHHVQHSFETLNILTQLPTIERLSMTRYFYLFPGN
ncbi:CASP12 isoform 11 [Pan troglodytes]|uniref:CASP12 isoform 11 n=1 Tax=Pan troglodytes TaxID=9598 RepID=A0A2J8LBT0_PANTR|nr:CASP12 isoform 11 [Pan troglodytes]